MKYTIIKSIENGNENYLFQVGNSYYWADRGLTMDHGIETMIFSANAEGEVTNWGELYVDHTNKPLKKCIEEFADSLITPEHHEESITEDTPDYMKWEPCDSIKKLMMQYEFEKEEYSGNIDYWDLYLTEHYWNTSKYYHKDCGYRVNKCGTWKLKKNGKYAAKWDVEVAFREHEELTERIALGDLDAEIAEFQRAIQSPAYSLAKQYIRYIQEECPEGMMLDNMEYAKLSEEAKFDYQQYVIDLLKSEY